MGLRGGLLLALMLTWSCSGDEDKAAEPVAAEHAQKVPDAPGADTGEAAAKPAGAGSAAPVEAAPAVPPPQEKSQPDVQAAAKANIQEGDWIVKAKSAHVRQGPGTTHPVVRSVHKGDKLVVLDCSHHWCKLGDQEFISQKLLRKAK